jgi:TolB-like protein
LSGSLQTQDARTRVAMQLINLSTQQFVWAEVYEQQQADMFTLQDQLGETIAADVIAYLQQQQ